MSNLSAAATESAFNDSSTAYPTTYDCQLISISSLNARTFQIELESPVDTILDYRAGQYLQLELAMEASEQAQSFPYSIANHFNPEQPRLLQLFIQNNSELSGKILKHLSELNKNKQAVRVTLPMGNAFLQSDLNLTHILVAAGSGISQVKCLAEAILNQQADANIKIYWSNRNIKDFYLLDKFQGWQEESQNIHFSPILEAAHSNWTGRSGYLYKVIKEDFKSLIDVQLYLCGSPQMVYGTIDKLKEIGLKEENCYSDVFEYAPRT